jgi:hypothetical protein
MSAAEAQRPAAWLVVDSRGRRSVYLDRSRAESQAVAQHGVLVELVPRVPLNDPKPDEVPDDAAA